jgi:hypothetical protein
VVTRWRGAGECQKNAARVRKNMTSVAIRLWTRTESKVIILGARQKLNAVYLVGEIFLAGIVGIVMWDWIYFFVLLAILIAISVYAGRIRPTRRDSGHSHRRPRRE